MLVFASHYAPFRYHTPVTYAQGALHKGPAEEVPVTRNRVFEDRTHTAALTCCHMCSTQQASGLSLCYATVLAHTHTHTHTLTVRFLRDKCLNWPHDNQRQSSS